MEYYARPENDAGEKEPLSHHLQRVSELCAKFCAPWGEQDLGACLGLFHDFGKYGHLFQAVLNHQAEHIDHALPGAALLESCLYPKRSHKPLSPAVVAARAHHSHLTCFGNEIADWNKGCSDNTKGMRYSLPGGNSPECKTAVQVFCEQNTLPPRPASRPLPTDALEWMLYTRMLYSALVDADYSASAEHYQPNYLAETSIPPLDASAVWEHLKRYIDELQRSSTADPSITALRQTVFSACAQVGAEQKPGLFTLSAPTGSGKTLAMLAFALQQMLCCERQRIIVVLPYLSILEQNAAVYRALAPDLLEDHSQRTWKPDDPSARELAQRWDAPFIVTTSVQFFESLFADSGPECRKLHQIANSVILFDEAQTLPSSLLHATLRTVKTLCERYGCTVVFSTATQPAFDLLPNLSWTPCEILPDPQALHAAARRVDVSWQIAPQSLEAIAARMVTSNNACAIVNVRRHAQALCAALRELAEPDAVFLLSTDLCPSHRADLLRRISQRLREGKPCYLAATQCIEAGVDLSFDTMFRALAPLESIIQAAGRCNRHDARRRGAFTVFVPDEEGRLYPDDFYEQCANAVKTLAARHLIDLYDLGHIREYYAILYQNGNVQDLRALDEAIQARNFQKAHEHYHFIEKSGVTVVVPYEGKLDLYQELRDEAKQGITPRWLRKAAPLCVNCYNEDLVRDCCEQLYLPPRRGIREYAPYYLLGDSSQYDSVLTGLRLQQERDLIC